MQQITIRIPLNLRKQHSMSPHVEIEFPKGAKPMALRDYIFNSLLNWFEEYDNQPTASQLHPE